MHGAVGNSALRDLTRFRCLSVSLVVMEDTVAVQEEEEGKFLFSPRAWSRSLPGLTTSCGTQ